MDILSIPPKEPGENGRKYAYRVLYNGIMSLDFPPGMLLVDAELSQALQISRTPIREAIVSLVESKLVEVYPQRSSCVSRLNLDAIEEGVFLRYNIERAILREAIRKADGNDLSLMRQNIEQQKSNLESGNLDRYMELDNAFHKLLYLAAGKPWTWSTVMRIVTHHDRVRRLQVRLGTDQLWPAHEEHRQLFHAVMTRSEANMDDFLYEHLTAGYRGALPELMQRYPDYFAI
ncbi:MAG: GntR family transcriptional regulator [Candidatus Aphodomorpha sp.]